MSTVFCRVFALLIATVWLGSEACADVRLCNKSTANLQYAYGLGRLTDEGASGKAWRWWSVWWHFLDPDQCTQVKLENPADRKFYYWARSIDTPFEKWSGDDQDSFCVYHPDGTISAHPTFALRREAELNGGCRIKIIPGTGGNVEGGRENLKVFLPFAVLDLDDHQNGLINFTIPGKELVAATPSAVEWSDPGIFGDWGDHDRGCSQGAEPDPTQCRPEYRGQVAVCWGNRRTGECGGATAWCTYKTVGLTTPQNGAAPGHIYYCGNMGTVTKRTPICIGEHENKIINFNPLKNQDEHGCNDHPGFVHQGCSDAAQSANAFCGGQLWTIEHNFGPVSGNKCGYAWLTIICWSGH